MEIRINPIGKPRMTQRDKWAKRKCVVKYFEFADKMREEAEEQHFRINDAVEIEFRIAMPKSWSKKKKIEMLGQSHTQKPDIDNLIKAVLDSLLKDDSGVHTVRARKYWGIDGQIKIINISENNDQG